MAWIYVAILHTFLVSTLCIEMIFDFYNNAHRCITYKFTMIVLVELISSMFAKWVDIVAFSVS